MPDDVAVLKYFFSATRAFYCLPKTAAQIIFVDFYVVYLIVSTVFPDCIFKFLVYTFFTNID